MKKTDLAKLSWTELTKIKQFELERFQKFDKGIVLHPYFLRPAKVKILMLVDNGISFNQFYFGLSEVLDTLYNNPEWWVEFEITKAHRAMDPNKPPAGPAFDLYGPDFENFRFTQAGFNINDYDQLWLFGFNSGTTFPQALNDTELGIVYKWMNEKKAGVLAMGDHASLGEALCSKIPRVRNMRKWKYDPVGLGAASAPTNYGANRHDTLMKGHDFAGTAAVNEANQYTFDDESDDVPMNIRLKWYYSSVWPFFNPQHWFWPYKWKRYPHPVLCGKSGPIKILPDHPHEGECVVPADLTKQPIFNGYQFDEYPSNGSSRISPEIIAWAHVQDDHKASDFKGTVNAKEFGAIGAYNGHLVEVGRVVVDSTWHHWFDVNLTGRMLFGSDTPVPGPSGLENTGDPRKLNGFNDTPAGIAAINKIRNYYRNVAVWLSPPDKINQMNRALLWNSILRYPLYADLNYIMPAWIIGHHSIDVLGNFAGQCSVRGIWWPLVKGLKLERLFDPKFMVVPIDIMQQLDEFMIGGILKSMLKAREEFISERIKLPTDSDLEKMVQEGIKMGYTELKEFIEQKNLSERNFTEMMTDVLG